jgi:TP901 family phage tail tape measure protein
MADYNLGTAKGKVQVDYDGKGVDQAKKDFGTLGKSAKGTQAGFNEVGRASTVAGIGIAAGLGLAAKVAIDFEKQISAIGAVSGATSADLEALRKKALQIGADTTFSASQAAAAMEELAKAGVPLEGILNGAADATVALAAAGGVELPAAAELAADAMNSFGLSAQQMPHIADLIAGAANASSISVGDFGQSLKQVGAVAKLAGLSFDDTAVAIALMGKAGIKGSDAGTSLKTMLSNLQPVTKKQIDLFKELGLVTADGTNQFFDQHGKIKSLADISQILNTATSKMTQQQKLMALEMIFGSDAIRAAAVLTGEGKKGFEDMATAMGKVTAQEVAAKRLDNTAGAIEQLKGSAETAAISLGTALLPALTKIAKALTQAANWFNGLSAGTKETITNVALVTAGILLLVGTAVKIFQFAKAVQAVVIAMKAWTIWTNIVKAATAAWTAVQWALNAALFANPIGLIILAVLALIAVIVLIATKTTWFQTLWRVVWGAIKTAAGAVADWFMNSVVPLFKSAWDKISGFFNAAWKVIKGILDFFIGGFRLWWSIVGPIIRGIGSVFKAAFGVIASVVKLAWSIISAVFAVWKTVMAAIWGPILNGMVAIFDWAFRVISAGISTAWNFIKGVTEFVWNAISGFLTGIWNAISGAASTAWDAVKSAIIASWELIKPYVMAAVLFVQGILDKAWAFISGVVSIVWNAIKTAIFASWEAIKKIIQTAVNAVVAIMNGIKKVVDNVRGFFNELKAAADGGTGTLIAFVKGIPGRVLAAIGNLGSLLYNKGRDLVQGLINGIRDMIGNLRNAAGDLVGAIGRFLPGSPAKEGPLSGQGYVLKRGQRFVDDFAAGILGRAKLARNAMETMMADAALALPVNSAPLVAGAQAGIAPITVSPIVQPASAPVSSNSRTLTIQNLNLQGVWDFNRPDVPKQIVARLHQALDDYEKEHR